MPKGVYARVQETQGYRDRSYWAKKIKAQAGFVCQRCGRYQPASLLRVRPLSEKLTLDAGEVLCFRCLAEEEFGGDVVLLADFLLWVSDAGVSLTSNLLKQWTREGLLPKPLYGFLPMSLRPKVALLFHNRSLPTESLRELLSRQKVETLIMRNLKTGKTEILTVIEEFPAISLDGHRYYCRRLLNGDILTRSERRKKDERLVQS